MKFDKNAIFLGTILLEISIQNFVGWNFWFSDIVIRSTVRRGGIRCKFAANGINRDRLWGLHWRVLWVAFFRLFQHQHNCCQYLPDICDPNKNLLIFNTLNFGFSVLQEFFWIFLMAIRNLENETIYLAVYLLMKMGKLNIELNSWNMWTNFENPIGPNTFFWWEIS